MKLNLGVGAYRTEVISFVLLIKYYLFVAMLKLDFYTLCVEQEGKPLILNVVRKAEQILVNDRY